MWKSLHSPCNCCVSIGSSDRALQPGVGSPSSADPWALPAACWDSWAGLCKSCVPPGRTGEGKCTEKINFTRGYSLSGETGRIFHSKALKLVWRSAWAWGIIWFKEKNHKTYLYDYTYCVCVYMYVCIYITAKLLWKLLFFAAPAPLMVITCLLLLSYTPCICTVDKRWDCCWWLKQELSWTVFFFCQYKCTCFRHPGRGCWYWRSGPCH